MNNICFTKVKKDPFKKNWIIWLFLYEFFALLYNLGNIKDCLFKPYLLLPIIFTFLFSVWGVKLMSKYSNRRKILINYIHAILIILLFYSPLWSIQLINFSIKNFYYMAFPLFLGLVFFGVIFTIIKHIKKHHLPDILYWFLYFITIATSAYMTKYVSQYEVNWEKYLEGFLYVFLFFQFFMGPFYALLLLPFTYALVKDNASDLKKGKEKQINAFDIIYLFALSFFPWLGMHFLYKIP